MASKLPLDERAKTIGDNYLVYFMVLSLATLIAVLTTAFPITAPICSLLHHETIDREFIYKNK